MRDTGCAWLENCCIDGLVESLLNRVRCCPVDSILFFTSIQNLECVRPTGILLAGVIDGCLFSVWLLELLFSNLYMI